MTDSTYGTPEQDAQSFDGVQSYDNTCAIRSQEFIIEQFTGQEIDEHALVQEAQDMGWYDPGDGTPGSGGTMPEDMGNLLELHGIPVNNYENATTYDLANELAQGHKVMISVDSGELWGEESPVMEDVASAAGVDGADHALVVSGIDATDPNHPQVIISDPGTGEAEARYPLDQFVSAWQDSNFQMVTTQNPAPSSVPGMENFDYEAGHIPEVADMPYDEFVTTYEDNPEGFHIQEPPGGWAPGIHPEQVDFDQPPEDNTITDNPVLDAPYSVWSENLPEPAPPGSEPELSPTEDEPDPVLPGEEDPIIEEIEEDQRQTWVDSFSDPYSD